MLVPITAMSRAPALLSTIGELDESVPPTHVRMPVERKADLHLEIAHVLFMDVVGFSKLLINDQSEILEQLNQLVHDTPHFREAETACKLMRLSTGNGMALVFSNSAEAPVECALEIN